MRIIIEGHAGEGKTRLAETLRRIYSLTGTIPVLVYDRETPEEKQKILEGPVLRNEVVIVTKQMGT